VALGEPTELALLIEDGDGALREFWKRRIPAGAALRESVTLDSKSLGMEVSNTIARLILRSSSPDIDWRQLQQSMLLPSDAERRNVLLLTLDTTRRDALGFVRSIDALSPSLAEGASSSPRLDALARQAILWRDAYSPAPTTAPSHASLFLSQPPSVHGLRNNGRALPLRARTSVIAHLQAWGYDTRAFISLAVLDRDTGFGQDFDHYDDDLPATWSRPAAALNEKLFHSLQTTQFTSPDGRPGFLWLHYSDPHLPYGTSAERGRGIVVSLNESAGQDIVTTGRMKRLRFVAEAGRHQLRLTAPNATAPYEITDPSSQYQLIRVRASKGVRVSLPDGKQLGADGHVFGTSTILDLELSAAASGEFSVDLGILDLAPSSEIRRRYADGIRQMDDGIGAALDSLRAAGWLSDAILAVVADHGEDLGGEDGRYGHIENVGPSLSRVPMFLLDPRSGPRIIDGPVSLVDLAPSLFGSLGLPADSAWRGIDARAAMSARPIFLESFPPEASLQWRGLVYGGFKLTAAVDSSGERDGNWQLFDVLEDPQCRVDLLTLNEGDTRVPDVAMLDELKRQWKTWTDSKLGNPGEEVDPRMIDRLRALGYLN
jgi:hypothetical protein